MAIDFADEAQCQVELVVILPARAGYTGHDIDKPRALIGGRAKGNE